MKLIKAHITNYRCVDDSGMTPPITDQVRKGFEKAKARGGSECQ